MTNKHNIHGTDLERWRAIRDQALNTLRRLDTAKRERNRAIIQQARDTLRRTDLAERERRRAIIAEARATLRRGQTPPKREQHKKNERRLVIEQAREALGFATQDGTIAKRDGDKAYQRSHRRRIGLAGLAR